MFLVDARLSVYMQLVLALQDMQAEYDGLMQAECDALKSRTSDDEGEAEPR